MISVSNKEWSERIFDINRVDKCSQDNDFSQILSKLIISRKFNDEEIHSINNPDSIIFSNVFRFNIDFKNAVKLVSDVIDRKEKICIFGDYDVDGSCATALIIKFFKSIDHPHFYLIPDREKDGYGLNVKLVKKIIKEQPKLIIMVDNGSNSTKEINLFKENKIDALVIDHHQINEPFPKANVIINPKKNNGYIKNDYMCATLLTFFFIDLLKEKIATNFHLNDYLIYPLMATICDVMPLRNVNRFLAIYALKKFDLKKINSIKIIFDLLKNDKKISIDDFGFLIGPILNAGGRLDDSNLAVKLLSSNNLNEIKSIGKKLINLNNKRKILEDRVLNDIDYNKIKEENKNVILYYSSNIKEGLIGIIASRLKDLYNKPAIVLTDSNSFLKGSARSIFGFDIGLAIKNAFDYNLILRGGGHKMAAGFSIEKKKLKSFDDFINNYYKKVADKINIKSFYYDAKISGSALNKFLFDDIKKLKPFGSGNPNPLFLIEKLKIKKAKVLNDKHISNIFISKNGLSIRGISFNAKKESFSKYLLNYKKEINVVGYLSENFWNNKKTLQLVVRDLII